MKRPILVLPLLALLAACGEDAPVDDGRAASGEVLEGTISDAMLPVDRVRSEPPLEDPEAFAEARSADEEGAPTAEGEDDEPADASTGDAGEPEAEASAEPETE